MRLIKITAVLALAVAFMATTAMAGGPSCGANKTSASSSSCLTSVFAGANSHCSASKAKFASMISVETTRMPSGALVVMYRGKDESTVAYLQAASCNKATEFCCPLTSRLAANEDCHVEIAKTKDGAVIVVTSQKPELVDEYETAVMQLASN